MPRVTSFLILAMLWLAGAPTQAQVAVSYADARDFYSVEYVGYVASLGPIPTVVFGDPFGPANDAALVAMLPAPSFVARASFAPGDAVLKQEFDRVVLSFNPIGGYQAYDLCARTTIPSATPVSGTQVIAALCRGRYVVSQATFTAPAIASPDDPVLRELMARVSVTLFPSFIKPGHGGKGAAPTM